MNKHRISFLCRFRAVALGPDHCSCRRWIEDRQTITSVPTRRVPAVLSQRGDALRPAVVQMRCAAPPLSMGTCRRSPPSGARAAIIITGPTVRCRYARHDDYTARQRTRQITCCRSDSPSSAPPHGRTTTPSAVPARASAQRIEQFESPALPTLVRAIEQQHLDRFTLVCGRLAGSRRVTQAAAARIEDGRCRPHEYRSTGAPHRLPQLPRQAVRRAIGAVGIVLKRRKRRIEPCSAWWRSTGPV